MLPYLPQIQLSVSCAMLCLQVLGLGLQVHGLRRRAGRWPRRPLGAPPSRRGS